MTKHGRAFQRLGEELRTADARIAELEARNVELEQRLCIMVERAENREARLKEAEGKRDQLYNALEPVERHNKIASKIVELSEGEWSAVRAALSEIEQPAPDSPWATFPQLLQSITEERQRATTAEARAETAERELAEARERHHNAANYYQANMSNAENRAESAEALLEGVKESNQIWKKQYREAEADAGRLREALRRVEWVSGWDVEGHKAIYCPWCNRIKGFGHTFDCVRQAALSPAEADVSHWIGVSEEIERDRDRLRAVLREAIGELQVIEKRATAVVGLAAYEIEHIAAEARKSAQAALAAEQADDAKGVK